MTYKKLILNVLVLSLNLLFLQATYSQENLQPGYIIQKTGDTLKGLIDYRNWENNPTSISFTVSAAKVPDIYSPNMISSFFVNNEVYKSAVVKAEISSVQTNQLDFLTQIRTRTDTAFVLVLVSGIKNLYYYSDKTGKQNFYIGKAPDFELLIYKKYLKKSDRENIVIENKNFLGQVNLYLDNCESIKEKINNTTYSKKSLKTLFVTYYECIGAKINHQYEIEKLVVDFGAVAGVSLTNLILKSSGNDFESIANIDYSTSLKFSGGLFMDVILARNQRKWSIYNELLISSYNVTGQSTDYFNEEYYTIYNNNIGYTYLKMNNMLRFTYPILNKDIFVFINLGISNGIALTETNFTIKEAKFYSDPIITEERAIEETRKYEQGFLAGIGAKYSKFSFESRFETGNGMSTYTSLNSKVNRFYFLLGYRF